MLQRYLVHEVKLHRGPSGPDGAGRDQYGEPLPGVVLTLPARVEWDNRLIVDDAGREVVCAGTVYLAATYDANGEKSELRIGPEDQIEFEGQMRSIVARQRCQASSWPDDPRSHWELLIR